MPLCTCKWVVVLREWEEVGMTDGAAVFPQLHFSKAQQQILLFMSSLTCLFQHSPCNWKRTKSWKLYYAYLISPLSCLPVMTSVGKPVVPAKSWRFSLGSANRKHVSEDDYSHFYWPVPPQGIQVQLSGDFSSVQDGIHALHPVKVADRVGLYPRRIMKDASQCECTE